MARFELRGKRVWVAGATGMAGGAIARRLRAMGIEPIETSRRDPRPEFRCDLMRQDETDACFARHQPQAVFLAAAKVGGIQANNTKPAEFIHENLAIQTNVIHGAWKAGVKKLLFLGSSCIYPNNLSRPIREDDFLNGPLEPTNQWYAIAKIAGIKMCDAYRKQYGADFISCMPTNLHGQGDNYDLASSHVVAALMVKIHAAKLANNPTVEIWGTGTPRREFLAVDDFADACIFLMENYSAPGPINVGTGVDMTITELAEAIARVVGWKGSFVYNRDKPDGTRRKLLDVSRMRELGWTARTPFEAGLKLAYDWYVKNAAPKAA